jgi:pyridoxamine 5'-phosphate oxidase
MTVTVADDPLVVLRRWYAEAQARLGEEGNCFVLATTTADAVPSARVVLCRAIDELGGVTFYTNYDSRKGAELAANPRAAGVFHWWSLDRQARVEGTVARVSAAASDAYWAGRHRGSQLTAWASRQSAAVQGRDELVAARAEAVERFEGRDVPRPAGWGGFTLRPDAIELWTRGAERLHERVRFVRQRGDAWHATILAP